MITDLELAVATLIYKAPIYDRLFAYYEGNQPLVYSNDRLRDIFKGLNARFSQNWCAVVIDSVLERIDLQAVNVADDEAMTKALNDLLNSSELQIESNDVHLAALVTGESFVIAWPDEETGEAEAYYNDPRNVHLFYEADRPRRKRFACKWWIGDDDYRYLTLYYADRLEYYKSTKQVRSMSNGTLVLNQDVSSGKGFERISGEDGEELVGSNPYGVIPVFHFRRDRRIISSELQNILEPQNAVNKLLSDMMVAAEFGAFKQRWIISNGDVSVLKNSPNAIWAVPAGDGEEQPTAVGEFQITPLANYLEAISNWTTSIAIISRTPKHYFFAQGGDPSGESLIAMEAPLNHKAQKYINRFMATWSELAAFMLQISGNGEVDDNAIVPVFDKPQTVQPYTQALIRKESVAAGVPLMWQMKQEGYTEQELAELDEAVTEKADADMERMAQVMEQRQAQLPQNGARSNGQPPRGGINGR